MSPRARVVLGVVLAVVGAVWAVQGMGLLRGSPMTGEPVWSVVGSFLVIAGVVVAVSGRRRT